MTLAVTSDCFFLKATYAVTHQQANANCHYCDSFILRARCTSFLQLSRVYVAFAEVVRFSLLFLCTMQLSLCGL